MGGFTDGSVEIGGSTVSIKLIVGVLILIGVTFFVFQNTQDVPLRWLFFEFTMPLWGLTLVLFGASSLAFCASNSSGRGRPGRAAARASQLVRGAAATATSRM
jgi:hypothetical protein